MAAAIWRILLCLTLAYSAADTTWAQRAPTADDIIGMLRPLRPTYHLTLSGLSATCFLERGPHKGEAVPVPLGLLGEPCTDGEQSDGTAILDKTSFGRTQDGGLLGNELRLRVPPPAPVPQPVRAFSDGSKRDSAEFGAHGVVAIPAKSAAENRTRLLRLCSAFVIYMPRLNMLPPWVGRDALMQTVWPLDQPDAAPAKADRCDFIVSHYDHRGGMSAMRRAARLGAKLDGRGPFLIAWSSPGSKAAADNPVLSVDLSAFDSQGDFDRALLFWQSKVAQDPSFWRPGLSEDGVRFALLNFSRRNGEALTGAVSVGANRVSMNATSAR